MTHEELRAKMFSEFYDKRKLLVGPTRQAVPIS